MTPWRYFATREAAVDVAKQFPKGPPFLRWPEPVQWFVRDQGNKEMLMPCYRWELLYAYQGKIEEIVLTQPPFDDAASKANFAHVACWLELLANLEHPNNRGLYDRTLLTSLAALADHDRPNWSGYYIEADLGDRIRALPAWDDPQPNEG